MQTVRNLLFFLLFFLSFIDCFTQQNAQQPIEPWQHPILKALEKKAPYLITFSHLKKDDYYVPLAVLNKTTNRVYYINTFGYLFDSIPVDPLLAKELASHKINAFDMYTKKVSIITLIELEEIKDRIRTGKPLAEKLDPHKTYMDYSALKNASSNFRANGLAG